jgi:hypothetical protein
MPYKNPSEHKEQERERQRKYYDSHKDLIQAKRYKYNLEHPEISRERSREYDKKYPDKLNARVRKYQKANHYKDCIWHMARRLVPLAKYCEICGGNATERHHPDYSKPLFVRHLCTTCHKKLHSKYYEEDLASEIDRVYDEERDRFHINLEEGEI